MCAPLLTRVLSSSAAGSTRSSAPAARDVRFGPAGSPRRAVWGPGDHHRDCGITAVEAVRARPGGRHRGHRHRPPSPGDELPPASAVLDPQRADCRSEAKQLCGTGVAFKLAQALVPALGCRLHLPLHFLDLVALATVADVVPLTGENRILVRHGLKLLAGRIGPGCGRCRNGGPRGEADQVGSRRVQSWRRVSMRRPDRDANTGCGCSCPTIRTRRPRSPASSRRSTPGARRWTSASSTTRSSWAERVLVPEDRALVLAADAWHRG